MRGSALDAWGDARYVESAVALQVVRDFSPFGWSVGRAGRSPSQVRDDVRSVVERVTARWRSVFPDREGYRVEVTSPAGASNGVQLMVRRGNFHASVSVESILDPTRRPGTHAHQAVRMFGRAEATSLVTAERAGHQMVQRLRGSGMVISAGLFVAALWTIAGAHSGAYILAGLLTAVAGITMTTLGASLGAYLGEQVGEKARRRAIAATSGDQDLQDDLRRWRALSRELSSIKQELRGAHGAGPFRGLCGEPGTRAASGPLALPPKPLATSFSFSSS